MEEAGPYAAEDADITLRLHQALWPRLEEEAEPAPVFREIELPLVPVLSRMERQGALLSRELLRSKVLNWARGWRSCSGVPTNWRARSSTWARPNSWGKSCSRNWSCRLSRKRPKGAPSTAEDVLAELALDYPLPKLLLEYRSLSKLKSTYTDKLPDMINPLPAGCTPPITRR